MRRGVAESRVRIVSKPSRICCPEYVGLVRRMMMYRETDYMDCVRLRSRLSEICCLRLVSSQTRER